MEPQRPETPHTPPPSLWPVGFAVGVAVLLVGLIVGWGIVLLGALLTLGFGYLWVRDLVLGPPQPPTAPDEAPTGHGAAPVPVGGPRREAALPAMSEEEIARYPRNVFLEGATLGLGALIGGIVTAPVIGFAVLPAFVDQEPAGSDLGPLDNFPENDWRVATFLEDPEAGEVSRRTAFVRYNGDVGGQPSFTILSNRCVHLGCPTQPGGPIDTDNQVEVETEVGRVHLIPTQPAAFQCPCHGGAYDTEGNRTAGPPVRALDRYEFSIRGNRLFIGRPYSVGNVEGEGGEARIAKYDRFYPGAHVDGISRILYPFPAPSL